MTIRNADQPATPKRRSSTARIVQDLPRNETGGGSSGSGSKLIRGWAGASAKTGLGRTQLWRKVRAGTFPAPIEISDNSIGWPEEAIDAWLRSRPRRTYGVPADDASAAQADVAASSEAHAMPEPAGPKSVADLGLPSLIRSRLAKAGVTSLEDLLSRSERALLHIPLFGRTSLREVEAALARHGLRLTTDRP
jgi:prophage regulatory protein